jgi:uncharacterized membrane protein YedE/YeeE
VTAFTILGLLVFWWLCFGIGYELGRICDIANIVRSVNKVFDAHVTIMVVAAASCEKELSK